MTDELSRPKGEDTYEIEQGLDANEIEDGTDARPDPEGSGSKREEPNAWLKEGADAPDAADIADPSEQR
ncbi:MAG TPA: hypothetical protein VM408_09095 [Methylomirabilota bacterium]|nr:hypothetical protein [Methylomirabilota bacterium]